MEKEAVLLAAKGCYYPMDDKEKQCMAWVIECLVLPESKDGYSMSEMEDYIMDALVRKGMTP